MKKCKIKDDKMRKCVLLIKGPFKPGGGGGGEGLEQRSLGREVGR